MKKNEELRLKTLKKKQHRTVYLNELRLLKFFESTLYL